MKNTIFYLKQFLIKVSHIQAAILMFLVYFLIINPMAIFYQLFRQKKSQKNQKTYWIKKEKIGDFDLYLKRQF